MAHEDVEARWVQAWDELLTLSKGYRGFVCLLPDGSMVDVEAGLGWLQEQVYRAHWVRVESAFVRGRPGACLSAGDQPP